MKCPKCQYISFDSGDRCRNCGYEFSLAADAAAGAPSRDLPIKTERDTDGPLGDFSLNTPNLPLFKPETGTPDAPLVAPPAAPRAPLAVRRPAPAAPRPKPKKESAAVEPLLDLAAADPVAASGFPSERAAPVPPREAVAATADHAPAAASALARVAGGAIDFALISAIDVLVIYFTLRICDLTFDQMAALPLAPLISFFLLLNGGYLSAFVAAGGQTIGKMAVGTRVIPAAPETSLHGRVSFGQAVVRAAGYLVSALPLGLGFLPALAGERRAFHDRLADTRVVKA